MKTEKITYWLPRWEAAVSAAVSAPEVSAT